MNFDIKLRTLAAVQYVQAAIFLSRTLGYFTELADEDTAHHSTSQ